MYLRILRDHENLMTQNGSKKAIEDAHAHVDLRKTFQEYKTANAVVNAAQKKLCRNIATAAFSLFRRMLDGTAKQWDMIDTEVHSDSTHTDLKGLTVDGPKGSSWATLLLCIEKHKLHVSLMQLTNNVGTYL